MNIENRNVWLIFLMMFFLNCSDESPNQDISKPDNNSNLNEKNVMTIYELGACDELFQGLLKFVESEKNYYVCDNREWKKIMPSSSNEEPKSSQEDSLYREISSSSKEEQSITEISSSDFMELISSSVQEKNPESSSSVIPYSSSFVDTLFVDTLLIDERDGQSYKIVKIGKQIWMAQNLNYAVDSSWCYNNKSSNCDVYGRLYQWTAAMDIKVRYLNDSVGRIIDYPHQGVCPKGWHIPADEEWKMLADYARDSSSFKLSKGHSSDYGLALVSERGWFDSLGTYGGTDEFRFKMLPAGKRWRQGSERPFSFCLLGTNAYFWSTYEYSPKGAYHWDTYIGSTYPNVSGSFSHNGDFKESAYSVRCLKNNL